MPVWRFGKLLLRRTLPPFYRARVIGREWIPANGGVLVVLNHPADVDPPFVSFGCAPRPAQFVAAARHFTLRPLAWLLWSLGGIPLRTDRADIRALRHIREELAAGRLVTIFPEGYATFSDRLEPFHDGIGYLALTPGITVVPGALWGTERVMRGWLPVGRGPVRIAFGPPLELPTEGTVRERAADVTGRARAAIEGLLAGLVDEIGR